MKNNFIPYKQALELKELGFNEDCFAYYRLNTWDVYFEPAKMELFLHHCYGDDHEDGVNAPLWQQAFAWFRSNKMSDSCVCRYQEKDQGGILFLYCIDKNYGVKRSRYVKEGFYTYKEAEVACLKKLIKINKSKKCIPTKQN